MTARVPTRALPTAATRSNGRVSRNARTASRYDVTLRSFPGRGEVRWWHGRSGATQEWRPPRIWARGSHTSAHVGYPWRKRRGTPVVGPVREGPPCRYRKVTPPASRYFSSTPGGNGPPGLVARGTSLVAPIVIARGQVAPCKRAFFPVGRL